MSRRSTVGVEVDGALTLLGEKQCSLGTLITYKDMAIERPQAGLAIIWRSI